MLLWPEATNLLTYPLRHRCDLQMDMDILETISLWMKYHLLKLYGVLVKRVLVLKAQLGNLFTGRRQAKKNTI